jgi:hypothetical protein
MRSRFAPVLVFLFCLAATPALAGSVTITSNHDTTLFKSTGSNSLGAGIGMYAGTDANGASGDHRALISFDIAGIPGLAGKTITGVSLGLTLGAVAGGGSPGTGDQTPREIDLHRVTTAWGEGIAGSGTTQIGGTGQGFAAGNGDATWPDSSFSASSPVHWNSFTDPNQLGGGDFSSTVSASQTVGNPSNFTTQFTWGSTAAMVADVQSWLDTPATNFGWTLVNTDETDARTFRAFFTRDAATVPSQAAFIPQLTITFVPEPATLTSLLVGALGFAAVARRRKRRHSH